LPQPVTKAVVTVPAYFNDSQRQATKDAGRIAGLEVLRIINEPTASALAYGVDKMKKKLKVAVFDLGGGTFDVSILEMAEGVFEVKATNGDTFLGGSDFDTLLVQHLADRFKQESGIDLTKDRFALQRLREAAEKAKMDLDARASVDINLPYITNVNGEPKHLKLNLTRVDFDALVEPLVQRTLGPCALCLKDAGLDKSQIDEVLLVGGMTRSPRVQSVVKEFFRRTPSKGVNPDEAVALGAAIQGAVLGGKVKDLVLVDVTPLSLGTDSHSGAFVPFIPRNSSIPVSKSLNFTTVRDFQDAVEFTVLQGERAMAADNKNLGTFRLLGLVPAKRGVPQISVKFDIDANGILSVTAKDKGTNKEVHITLNPSGGLDSGELDRMINDAKRHEKADKERKELMQMKNDADALTYQLADTIANHGKKASAEACKNAQDALDALKTALASENLEQIKTTFAAAQEAASKLGDAIYKGAKDTPNEGKK
jgi:molecular chaperone DnaK